MGGFFFPARRAERKICFEAKLFSVEKVKKKKQQRSQGQYRKCSVCAMRLTLKEKDVHWSPPSLCVLLKKRNNWRERNWEAKVQLSERPSESSPWDESGKETKEERSGARKPSVPLCRQSLAVSLSARVCSMLNSGLQSSLTKNFQRCHPAGCWS